MTSHSLTPTTSTPTKFILVARDVHKSFGQTPALVGADLSVAAGEIVAVMGPSGSGKSTLLYCLAGVPRPDRGEVWFDGARVDGLKDSARTELRRRSFGFVFQFGQLVPELTAEENVALPLILGGQAQRVALARGLIATPKVLFADEPTGSLDSLTGVHVMDLLVETAKAEGTTVVLVTHEPRVAAYADREVVVRDGTVTRWQPELV
jgi:putative ABC transport system ATP-binding protein